MGEGKSAPTFGPLGPRLVTPDEIKDVRARHVALERQRSRMQTGHEDDGVRRQGLVSYISQFIDPPSRATSSPPARPPFVRLRHEAAAFPSSKPAIHYAWGRWLGAYPERGPLGRRVEAEPMRRLWCGGGGLRLHRRLAFVALYVDYMKGARTWSADRPLSLAALPCTLFMRWLNGGSFDCRGSRLDA